MLRPAHPLIVACAALAVLLLGGCAMKRSLTIDSNPTGAQVWVNGEKQAGTTPVTVPFSQYGYWDVRLEKRGYQSVATQVRVASQIDGYPVVDLPFEVLGGRRHFRRVIPMEPLPTGNEEARVQQILRDAKALREETHRAVQEPETPGRSAPEFVK